MPNILGSRYPLPRSFTAFMPFWAFLLFFKFGAGLHYTILAPLGEMLLPLWVVGLLVGGASFVQLILDVPAGHLLDRYGYLRLLRIGNFLFLFAAFFFILGLSVWTYVLSLLFSIVGWLFFMPGVNAYVLSFAPKESAGNFMAMRDVFNSVGVVLGSAALPFVLLLSVREMGIIIFVMLVASFWLLMVSPKDRVSVRAEEKLPTQNYYIKRHHLLHLAKVVDQLNPAGVMLILYHLTGAIFYGTVWFVVPLVIAHQLQSVNAVILGVGLGIFDFSIVVLGFVLGSLADRMNRGLLVFYGLLLFSLSGMILGFHFGWLFLVFGFLAAAGDETTGISLWSWLHALDKRHTNDGLIAGIISFFDDMGWTIGPVAAGFLYTLVGPSWTVVLGAVPIFAVWVAFQFMVRRHPLQELVWVTAPKKPHRRRHKS